MPAPLDACVSAVMDKGHDEKSAWAICKTSMDMKKDASQTEIIQNAIKIADDMKKKNYALETMDIEGVDIFAVGKWNGDEYSVEDLDNIVDAFNETKNKLRPYLKIGHGNKQSLLAEDELPAAGWISNIYRTGRKLMADFNRIPKKIYELLKLKAYDRVSAELYVDIPIDGKNYPLALKAVSILGGATPAVHDLDSILALYQQQHGAMVFETQAKFRRVDLHTQNLLGKQKTQEEKIMDVEELTKENDLLKEANKKLTEDNRLLKESQVKIEKDIAEIKAFAAQAQQEKEALKKEKRFSEISARVDQLVKDKKIIPAQSAALKLILDNASQERKFKLDDKEMTEEALILSFIDANGTHVLSTEESTEVGKKQQVDSDDQLASAAKEYAMKNKVSYKEALIRVASGQAN